MNPILPPFEALKKMAAGYGVVPIYRELHADSVTPILLLRRIAYTQKNCFLLESIPDGARCARFSFLGFAPKCRVTCKSGVTTVCENGVTSVSAAAPYETLRQLMAQYRAPRNPELPPFTGGLVGYFGYGMMQVAEPSLQLAPTEMCDFDLQLFDRVIAYDHHKQTVMLLVNIKTAPLEESYRQGIAAIAEMQTMLTQHTAATEPVRCAKPEFQCDVTEAEFCDMVERTKAYIRAGDIFQAVISRRFTAPYEDDLLGAYRVLRTTNPSPYMVYWQCEEVQLIAASPETLVKLRDGTVTTFPIAGSRPRGATAEEDQALAEALMQDEKELAEHNMLVDLGRNDIGRIAALGTVRVTEYQQLNRYSRIMHICSEVQGKLREGLDGLDAIAAVLPAGTLSGAPKIRACEIINALERVPRNIYGGALGYLDFTGDLDTCIAIRMAVKANGIVSVQAGAGIVADSVPKSEYQETAQKAGAVLQALTQASEVDDAWF